MNYSWCFLRSHVLVNEQIGSSFDVKVDSALKTSTLEVFMDIVEREEDSSRQNTGMSERNKKSMVNMRTRHPQRITYATFNSDDRMRIVKES